MPWLYPIGYEDPSGQWENEEAALEYDSLTAAYVPDLPPNTWTGWLVLTFTPCRGQYAQSLLSASGARGSYAVEYHDGTAWVPWHSHTNVRFLHEWQYVWWDRPVTKIRQRMMHHGTGPLYVRVHWCRVFAHCTGPLVPISEVLYSIRDFLWDLSYAIGDVFIIGEYLARPFASLGLKFHDVGDACCCASIVLQDILDTIKGGFTWAGFLGLLQQYAPVLYYLIVDPVGEILYLIGQAFNIEPWHVRDLDALTKYVLQTYLPSLYQLWLDPGGWFESVLQERFPVLYYLWRDPKGEILYLIGQAFDLEPWHARSPEAIVKALFERWFPELYLLWRELGLLMSKYKREGWVGVMTELKERFYGLAERALRFLWEGIW